MTGKVFEDSADIYDDEAQVLFDYYRQAAERIVAEETEIEQQVAAVEQDLQEARGVADKSGTKMLILGVTAGVAALLGLIFLVAVSTSVAVIAFGAAVGCGVFAFKNFSAKRDAMQKLEQATQRQAELQAAWQGIRREYHVDRVGVAYVPVARRVQTGEKSYLVDFTGDVPNTEFSLTLVNQPDELRKAMNSLSKRMEHMPAVESNEETEQIDTSDYSTSVQDVTLHDHMGAIDRDVRTVRYLIADSRNVTVELPVVMPTSERYRTLREYATTDPGGHPVVPVYDAREVQHKVVAFSELGALNQRSSRDGSGDVDYFVRVMRQLARGVDVLTRSRTASTSSLVNYGSRIFRTVLRSAYDQYSPSLEAEEIERIRTATFNYADEVGGYRPFALKESSRVRYDIFSDAWVADNGTRAAVPFGMHQVDIEVLMPVIGNLMEENRVERQRIYSDIQNQKTDYLNQWHRDTDDFFGRNRTEANALIQRMNEAYAEFVESHINYEQQSAAFKTMKATGNLADAEVMEAKNQADVIAGFELQTNQARAKQEEFTAFMERIREDIDQSAQQFGHVEYYEASLRDAQARETARAAAHLRELDRRRQRLAAVSAYLAEHGDVPPEPKVSERLEKDFTINLSQQAEGKICALNGTSAPAGSSGSSGEERAHNGQR